MTTSVETTFSLVATFQVWENYGAHDWDGKGECPQYWKAKGGHEVVIAEGLSVADAMRGSEYLRGMVMDYINAGAEDREIHDSEYYRYDLIDWSLEERSESVVSEVYEAAVAGINEGWYEGEYGYFVYGAPGRGMSEKTCEWALSILKSRGLLTWDEESAKWGNAPMSLVEVAKAA